MHRNTLRPIFAVIAVVALVGAGIACAPKTASFVADLKGSNEVPPTDSTATGTVDAKFDSGSKKLTWTIAYSGLTGDATAAHFHGPAAAGENAPPTVPIAGSLASPISGEATLTDAQAADLQAGRWYFNIHTEAHPGGEIRGQLTKK